VIATDQTILIRYILRNPIMNCKQGEELKEKKPTMESTRIYDQDKISLENKIQTLEDPCETNESSMRGYKEGFLAGFSQGYSQKSKPKLVSEAFDNRRHRRAADPEEILLRGQISPQGVNSSHLTALDKAVFWAEVTCNWKTKRISGQCGTARRESPNSTTILVDFTGYCYEPEWCKQVSGTLRVVINGVNDLYMEHATTVNDWMSARLPGEKRIPTKMMTGNNPYEIRSLRANIRADIHMDDPERMIHDYKFDDHGADFRKQFPQFATRDLRNGGGGGSGSG